MSKNDLELLAHDKKLYMFNNEAYYKVVGMDASYYMKIKDYDMITLRQTAVILYEHTCNGLEKVQSYIKSIDFSDILFIAAPTVAHHFKMYDLEKAS